MRKTVSTALLAGAMVTALSACQTTPPSSESMVHESTLDNGMKVIIKEDHRAPVMVAQVWYKVGASDEKKGKTGISHVLEHMMFKGTKNHGVGEFSRIIAENGGSENAFTGSDYTAYFQNMETSRLPISMQLESDRMRNLVVKDDEFAKELQVVMEERRMRTEDQPEARVYEQFMKTAYDKHPYHHPIIGWQKDLEGLTAQNIRDWYQEWYAPDNATLVVVGDVDPDQTLALAEKYYGGYTASGVKRLVPAPEPQDKGFRDVTVKAPATVPYVLMGWHVPVLSRTDPDTDTDPYALEVLAGVLSSGDSSRFQKNLVRGESVAASASAGYNMLGRGSTMFLIDGNPAKGHDVKQLEKDLLQQVEDIRVNGVPQKELDKVIAQVVAGDVFAKDSVYYQAMKIGIFETVGLDWRQSDKFVERVRNVTSEQIQAVIDKYLTDKNRVVAYLDPLPIEPGQHIASGTGGGNVH